MKDLAVLIDAIQKAGPTVVVIAGMLLLILWDRLQSHKREERQHKAIAELHNANSQTLLPVLEKCTEAIGACKEVISHNSQVLMGWIRDAGKR